MERCDDLHRHGICFTTQQWETSVLLVGCRYQGPDVHGPERALRRRRGAAAGHASLWAMFFWARRIWKATERRRSRSTCAQVARVAVVNQGVC